ncbi:SCO family protein [Phycisphaerales bacterium AB-hyl4]|uniref:SCO family protein n=1 Tax=Natronomicrosphaera hydrolytica TaxID=3242702 RepID=A0ABV4U1V4_9BACT
MIKCRTRQSDDRFGGLLVWLTAVVVVFAVGSGAWAQMVPAPPKLDLEGGGRGTAEAETRDLDLVEKLGDRVPLDATLVDETGQTVRLGDYFDADRPVILNLAYYGCPMLCGQMIRGLGTSLRELENRDGWVPGQDYEVVTISFDPTESSAMAAEAKKQAMRMLNDEQAAAGWHFLTGEDADVRAIAEAVGFPYRWSERAQQYVHPAAIMLLTPDGRVSRYLYGVSYPTTTLRLSLVESSEGKVGSTMDRVLLYCFAFDESRGEYTLVAMNLMRLAGAMTVVVLLIAIGVMTVRGMQRQAQFDKPTDNDEHG